MSGAAEGVRRIFLPKRKSHGIGNQRQGGAPVQLRESGFRMTGKNLKITIGPVEIAGYGENLAAGFRQLGVDAECCFNLSYAFASSGLDGVPWAERMARKAHEVSRKGTGNFFLFRLAARALHNLLSTVLLLRLISTRTHFISLAGNAYLGSWEWRLAGWCGCRTTVVFLGTESRPCYIGGNVVGRHAMAETGEIRKRVEKQKKRIRRIESLAHSVVSCEVIAHFLQRDYFDFFQIGFPRCVLTSPVTRLLEGSARGTAVKILHAPSNPVSKGTVEWRLMIEELRVEGIDIEFVELTGVSNSLVMDRIAECDFVVDELWADTPLGGLATEAGLYGKPAVVGGYAQQQLCHMRAHGAPLDCYVPPEETKDLIRKLCIDPEFRNRSGEVARAFILDYYSAAKVAARFVKILEGSCSQKWVRSPSATSYIHGLGLPVDTLHRWLDRYVREQGTEALLLADKPALERRFTEFVASSR